MAGTIKVEVFKKKDAEEFSACLADPESRLDAGGAAAMCAALAASLLSRAARITAANSSTDDKLEYILHNSEVLYKYMVHLIDEDVRCRGPLRKAQQMGDPRRIEAGSQSAVSICSEIVNMQRNTLDLLEELSEICTPEAKPYVLESAELSMGALRTAMRYILGMSANSTDETYRFVSRRENEITLEQVQPVYDRILARLAV